MKQQINAIKVNDEGLRLKLPDGSLSELFPWIWIRDHATEPHSFSADTQQRTVDVFTEKHIVPENVRLNKELMLVEIDWGDGFLSQYYRDDFSGGAQGREMLELPKTSWPEVNFESSDVQVPYAKTPTVDELLEILLKIQSYGFCFIENCPIDSTQTDQFLAHLGAYFNSHWGDFWEFENNLAKQDSAYSAGYIGPHTDCCYYDHSPYLQTFHCLMHDGEGGENFLVDGFAIANDIKATDSQAHQLLTRLEVPFQCINDDVSYRSEKPIIRIGGNGEVEQISYNNADRGKLWYGYEKTKQFYRAYAAFYNLANDPKRQFRFKLTPGSILIFNNWRLLHGRTAFTGTRRMCGCYYSIDSILARYQHLSLNK